MENERIEAETEKNNMAAGMARVVEEPDGGYHWYYDHQKPFDRTFWVIILIVIGSIGLLLTGMLLFVPSDKMDTASRWEAITILWGVMIFVFGLVIGITWLVCRARNGGVYRYRFRMDMDGVTTMYDTKVSEVTRKINKVLAVTDFLTGHFLRSAMYAAGSEEIQECTFRFRDIRKITLRPDEDTVRLRTLMQFMPVFIPAEDYRMVKDYIIDHVARNVKIVEK